MQTAVTMGKEASYTKYDSRSSEHNKRINAKHFAAGYELVLTACYVKVKV